MTVYYTVITASSEKALADKVEELLELGYTLQGGVSCSISESDEFQYIRYAQALVKRLPIGVHKVVARDTEADVYIFAPDDLRLDTQPGLAVLVNKIPQKYRRPHPDSRVREYKLIEVTEEENIPRLALIRIYYEIAGRKV